MCTEQEVTDQAEVLRRLCEPHGPADRFLKQTTLVQGPVEVTYLSSAILLDFSNRTVSSHTRRQLHYTCVVASGHWRLIVLQACMRLVFYRCLIPSSFAPTRPRSGLQPRPSIHDAALGSDYNGSCRDLDSQASAYTSMWFTSYMYSGPEALSAAHEVGCDLHQIAADALVRLEEDSIRHWAARRCG